MSSILIVDRLHALADHEMYEVKKLKAGGGVRIRRPSAALLPPPKVGRTH